MRQKSIVWILGTFAAVAVINAPSARAVTPNPQCVRDARAQMQDCKSTCQDDFQVAKDMCRNVDHACADRCRADRDACVAGPRGVLATCIAGCNSTLDGAKANCKSQFGPGGQTPDPLQLDQCIDGAQVIAFQCRDTCRENLDRTVLRQCRVNFRHCIHDCPLPPTQ